MIDFKNNQTNTPGSMPPPPGAVTPNQAQQAANGFDDLLINYNKKYAKATQAKYRDKEIFTVISHLMMSQKSCSLLIGAPGVGKTKIVEEIARLIANKSPYTNTLNDYTIYEMPLTNLMSGTSFRGQLEEKINEVIQYFEKEKVILFIDEIHQLVGQNSALDTVAQSLKPAMARGSIKIIGATTIQESKNLLDDPAFNRRFNRLNVCELSVEQTKDIIDSVYIPKMSNFYNIGFANNLAEVITNAAENSKTITCHRPDNAITMLDQVCANTVLKRNYNIATCTDDALKQQLESTPLVINAKHVEDYNKTNNFEMPADFNALKSKIFFRDDVIDKLYDTLKRHIEINEIFPDKKPFKITITGDKCSGKTTMAKELAKMFDEQPVYLDMSDYSDHASLNRLIGSPVGYIGSDSKKEMPFDIIESNPLKVIILDNFDACYVSIQDFMNAAINTSVIKYADNRMIDISKAIVIVTETSKHVSGKIGFTQTAAKEPDNKITLKELSDTELYQGAEMIIANMIKELKTNHTRYNNLPDVVELDENDKKAIDNAENMHYIAKRKLISMI